MSLAAADAKNIQQIRVVGINRVENNHPLVASVRDIEIGPLPINVGQSDAGQPRFVGLEVAASLEVAHTPEIPVAAKLLLAVDGDGIVGHRAVDITEAETMKIAVIIKQLLTKRVERQGQ